MNEIASSSTPPAAQPAPLRPCPFCGGEAKIVAAPLEHHPKANLVSGRDHFSTGYWIECCGNCQMRLGYREAYDDCEGGEFTTKEEAIAAWNHRAPDPSRAALAAAEAIEYHNPDNLPSPGEAPWRFLVKGEKPDNGDEQWSLFGVWNPAHTIVPELRTFRTRRPLPLAPAPAPEGRGETAETPETNEAWIAAKEKYLATYSPASKASHWFKVAEETREHAKRLERERNHLRKKVAQYRADFENANYRNEEMRRERDAAVAQAQALREAVALMLDWYNSQPSREVINLNAAPTIHEWANHIAAALAASEAGK